MNRKGNTTNQKTNGRFTKQPKLNPVPATTISIEQQNQLLIQKTVNELYANHFDLYNITKTYQLITGIMNPTSLKVMKATIINHVQNKG